MTYLNKKCFQKYDISKNNSHNKETKHDDHSEEIFSQL